MTLAIIDSDSASMDRSPEACIYLKNIGDLLCVYVVGVCAHVLFGYLHLCAQRPQEDARCPDSLLSTLFL